MTTTILKSGRVLDPAGARDEIADVVVRDGLIEGIGPGLAEACPDAELVDCTGLLVTPGLIDLHVHIYPGLGDFCVHPDRAGVEVGVPIIVDGGTSGVATFGVARARAEAPDVRSKVLALLDPCLLYLATKNFLPHRLHLADNPQNLDLDATLEAVAQHADMVVGFKVRATTLEDKKVSPFLEAAKSVAGELPIMIHLGSYPFTPSLSNLDAIAALRAGDIVTHAFRGHSGFPVEGGSGVAPQFREAIERGVRLDVGHSGSDFRFAAARQLFDLGYFPSSISTDLNLFNADGPVYSLPHTMSKIWALGVPLTDVVAMATINPAESIRRSQEYGSLAPGRSAEVSVLRIEEGPVQLSDGYETLVADRRLAPVGCLRAGEWIPANDPFTPPGGDVLQAGSTVGLPRERAMTYTISDACVDVKDRSCIEECPVDCIYEGGRRLYIQPYECIDCGACEPICPVDAIARQGYGGPDGSPEVAQNLEFFVDALPGRESPLGSPGSAADVGALDVDPPRVQELPLRQV